MDKRTTGINYLLKMIFGIFMVFVYLGMAFLMAINYFDFARTSVWNAIRWFFVVILAIYGIYRFYRMIKGDHTYGMRVYDDEEEEENKYSTYADSLKNEKITSDEKKN
jgi:cytochrome c biogenesis protein CcdA